MSSTQLHVQRVAFVLFAFLVASGADNVLEGVAILTIPGGQLGTHDVKSADACLDRCLNGLEGCSAWSFTNVTRYAECSRHGCCFLKSGSNTTIESYLRLCPTFVSGCVGMECAMTNVSESCPNPPSPNPPTPPSPTPPPRPPRVQGVAIITIPDGQLGTYDVATDGSCLDHCLKQDNCTAWSYTHVTRDACPYYGCCFLKSGTNTTIELYVRRCPNFVSGCVGMQCSLSNTTDWCPS
eukprot:m.261226 g.261226  ORF g.261226 m.261226 type:complete len:238 (-) comp41625_c0_seq1:287-1000(-)